MFQHVSDTCNQVKICMKHGRHNQYYRLRSDGCFCLFIYLFFFKWSSKLRNSFTNPFWAYWFPSITLQQASFRKCNVKTICISMSWQIHFGRYSICLNLFWVLRKDWHPVSNTQRLLTRIVDEAWNFNSYFLAIIWRGSRPCQGR